MNRRRSVTWKLLLVPLVCLAFNSPSCDNRPLTLRCDTISLRVDQGSCVTVPPPCDDHQWTSIDAFRLCDNIDGIFVHTRREPRAREICASGVGTLIRSRIDATRRYSSAKSQR